MTFMKILKLYGRNARGVFFGGFKIGVQKNGGGGSPAELFPLFHLAFLPITMTVGALIKTLIDVFTRKPIPKDEMERLKTSIEKMDDLNLTELTNDMASSKVKSNSSAMLLKQLGEEKNAEQVAIFSGAFKKRIELILDQLAAKEKHDPLKKYTMAEFQNFQVDAANQSLLKSILDQLNSKRVLEPQKHQLELVQSFQLDETHQVQLDEYHHLNAISCIKEKSKHQRTLIGTYLSDEKNEGKKLLHIIRHSVFAVKPSIPNEATLKMTLIKTSLDNSSNTDYM